MLNPGGGFIVTNNAENYKTYAVRHYLIDIVNVFISKTAKM